MVPSDPSSPPLSQASRGPISTNCGPGSLDRAGVVRVKYFGRRRGGAIRDGVLVAIIDQPQTRLAPAWSCDTDEVIAEMDAADGI
jgi:hypothetical protein